MQSSDPSQIPSPEGTELSMFSSPSQEAPEMGASKQLIVEVTQIHSSLKGLAIAHPEMSQSIDVAIQALTEGMTRVVSTMMPSRESEGSQPAYA